MNARRPRQFLVEHVSNFHYREPAHGSSMLLRLRPREEYEQRVLKFSLHIDPLAAPSSFEDSFGNACHLFNIHREHMHTTVRSQALIETVGAPPSAGQMERDAWDALADVADPVRYWEFLRPSRFARPGPALEAFTAASGIRRRSDPLCSLLEASATLHATFRYEPGSTEVDSPIERILETRSGVCQDYTHVMIAIARCWGIPSRYVSGYLHLEGAAGEQTLAGASHSWAEFLLPDLGWIGIDPTNDTLADHRHVRVAVGRDYADAAPTRGVVFAGGESRLEVRVTVVEGDEQVPVSAPSAEWANLRNVAPTPRVPQSSSDQ